MLRKMLGSLPKSLDDTYLRILESIDDDYFEDAYRLLKLLAVFAVEPTIREAAEFIAIDTEADEFDVLNRLPQASALLDLCGPMISTTWTNSSGAKPDGDVSGEAQESPSNEAALDQRRIRLAHYSVKEFLTSDRLKGHAAARYTFSIDDAHRLAAHLCLTYLQQIHNEGKLNKQYASEYPGLDYATQWGLQHASYVVSENDIIQELLRDLLGEANDMYPEFLAYVNPPSEDITLPGLYFACTYGFTQVAREMIEAGVDVNQKIDDQGRTLLQHTVISSQSREIVELLLDAGADVNAAAETPEGFALTEAAIAGNVDIVRRLLAGGADVKNQTAHYSALSVAKNRQIAKLLLEAGAELHAPTRLHGVPLLTALWSRNHDVACYLLENGADPNSSSATVSALGLTAYLGSLDTLKALLKHGADVNRDYPACGPALLQCLLRHDLAEDCLQSLLDAGADPLFVGANNPWGSTVAAASSAGRPDAVQMLLDKGASLAARSPAGKTPLHLAGHCSQVLPESWQLASSPKCDYPALVQFLVDRGGLAIDTTDQFGQNALLNACVGGNPRVIAKLLHLGADPNSRDAQGWSGLHWAAKSGQGASVRLLLDAGADPHARAPTGALGDLRPLDVAVYCGRDAVVDVLRGATTTTDDPVETTTTTPELTKFTGLQTQRLCDLCRLYQGVGQYYKLADRPESTDVFCFRCVLDLEVVHPGARAVPIEAQDVPFAS